jgi:CubicO group peptidase (beta-lactamase class C family)
MLSSEVKEYIAENIKSRVIPGLSLLVARGDDILIDEVFGYKSLIPQKIELERDAIYDLASLTKPLITALLIAIAVKEKKIKLSTEVKEIFRGFPYSININNLLTHTSGLPAWYPFYLFEDDIMFQIKRLPLSSKPGKRVNYSCIGYILLSKILEDIYQLPFKNIVKKIIIERLDLKNTFFGEVPNNKIDGCVPTELGNKFEKNMADDDKKFKKLSEKFNWRKNLIIGEINDANAFYLEGNSGNAGLFSTAKDILEISNEFYPHSTNLLSPEITRFFWENRTLFKKSHRTVGFKLNSSIITSGGRGISRKAIGHNGFTGVSLWLEPKTEYKFIILTNRIHPEVKPLPFNKVRRKLHKLIKKML